MHTIVFIKVTLYFKNNHVKEGITLQSKRLRDKHYIDKYICDRYSFYERCISFGCKKPDNIAVCLIRQSIIALFLGSKFCLSFIMSRVVSCGPLTHDNQSDILQ